MFLWLGGTLALVDSRTVRLPERRGRCRLL